MKTKNTKTQNTNAQSVKKQSEKTTVKKETVKKETVKKDTVKKDTVKIETLYNQIKTVIDLSKFDNVDNLAINELNFNEFVINQVVDNNLVALVKIYAHKNRYDLLLNKSRLTILFNNALKANELLSVDFNTKKLETKKQYVVELNLAQLEQYIMILFDLTKKQDNNKQ